MAEYIDRGIAIQSIDDLQNCYNGFSDSYDKSYIIEVIEEIPIANVKPVVYCKDCKHSYDDIGGFHCSYGVCVDCAVDEDFYCKNGERENG